MGPNLFGKDGAEHNSEVAKSEITWPEDPGLFYTRCRYYKRGANNINVRGEHIKGFFCLHPYIFLPALYIL